MAENRGVRLGRCALPWLFGLCLLLPGTTLAAFDGLPLGSWEELLALSLALPVLFGRRWRAAWLDLFHRRAWPLLLALTLVVIAAKALAWTGDDAREGFDACYTSRIAAPPRGACERSFENPFHRRGATRVDRVIDFGPHTPARPALVGDSGLYGALAGGVASTNWDLTFLNSIRFNFYQTPRVTERLPFAADWRGTLDLPERTTLRITYVGEGVLRVGADEDVLPASHSTTTQVEVRVPEGRHAFALRYWFDDGRREGGGAPADGPAARMRVMVVAHGSAAAAAAPALLVSARAPWQARMLGWLIDLCTWMLVMSLGAVYLRDAWRSARLAALLVAPLAPFALLALTAWQSPFAIAAIRDGAFLAASIVLLLLMAVRPAWRTRTVAFASMLLVHAATVIHDYPSLTGVVYRRPGSDWLTYESFVRDMLETWSLAGGEPLFHYQVGFRYILFALRLLLGDNDVLLAIAGGTFLSSAIFFAFIQFAGDRRLPLRWPSIVLVSAASMLLALMQGPFVTSLMRVGASEWPTWGLLPLTGALLLHPRAPRAIVWGALCASGAIFVRLTQAVGALAAIGIAARDTIWSPRSSSSSSSYSNRNSSRNSGRRPLAALIGAIALPLLVPAFLLWHNVTYAGRWVVLPVSASSPENIVLSAAMVRSQPLAETSATVTQQLRLIFYASPDHVFDERLRGTCHALLGLWLFASVIGLVQRPSLRTLARCAWPLAYLLPLIGWNVLNFYPRHLIAGMLATGVGAMAIATHLLDRVDRTNERFVEDDLSEEEGREEGYPRLATSRV